MIGKKRCKLNCTGLVKRVAAVFMAVILIIEGAGLGGFYSEKANADPVPASETVDFLTVSSGLSLTMEKEENSDNGFSAKAIVTAASIPDGSAVILKVKEAPSDVSVALEKSVLYKGESAEVTFKYDSALETTLKDILKNVKISGEIVKNAADTKELVLSDWEYHIEKRSNLDSGFVADGAYLVLDRYIGAGKDVDVYAAYYFTEAMHNDMLNRGFSITDVTITDDYYGKVLPVMMAGTDYDTMVESMDTDNPDEPEDSSLVRSCGPFIANDTITSVTFYNGIYDDKPICVNMSRLKNYDVITADNIKRSYGSSIVMLDNEDIYSYLDKDDDYPDDEYYSIELDESGNNKLTYETYSDVYSMKGMFAFCENLTSVNNIPDNVNIMTNTFRNCKSLISVSNLPEKLVDMEKTFFNCTNMTTVPQIPENVVNMLATFKNCKKFNPSEAVAVPEGVRNLMETFRGCQSMEKAPIISPYMRVYNLNHTFYNCKAMKELPILPKSVLSFFRTFNGCVSAEKIQNDNPHIIGNYSDMVITQNGILGPECDSSNIASGDILTALPTWLGYNLLDTYRGCKVLNMELYINSENGFNIVKYEPYSSYVGSPATYKSYGYFRSCTGRIYEEFYYNNRDDNNIESSKYYLDGKSANGIFWETSLDTSGVTINNGIKLYCDDSDVLSDISSRFVSLGDGVTHAVSFDGDTSTGATVIETAQVSVKDIKGKTVSYEEPQQTEPEILNTLMNFSLSARIANEVKYFSYDGQLLDTVRVTVGQKVSALTGPARENVNTDHSVLSYSFDKWVYKNNTQQEFNFDAAVTEDTELIAVYTETEDLNEYTVKFYDEDKATLLDTVTVEWGKEAAASVIPAKPKETTETKITTYVFDKWIDEAGNNADLTNIVKDLSVYAKYSEAVVEVINQELDHIEIVEQPDKVNYLYGDTFNKTGMVVDAIYKWEWSDGKIEYKKVKNVEYTVDETTPLKLADVSAEVSYSDKGITKNASQPIKVENYIKETVLDRIVIAKAPDKTVYIEGECFDDTGMLVDAVYKEYWADGTVTEKEQKNVLYDVDKNTELKISDNKWQVAYTDKITVYADVDISVVEKVKERFVTVRGTLKYSDGTPIANKKIELHSEVKTVYTDKDGNYEFKEVETGEHTLTIYSEEGAELAVCRLNVSVKAENDSIDITKKDNLEVSSSILGDEFVVNGFAEIKKPEESQPEESKPSESQPEESQPEESRPDESKPSESQPEESQPEESSNEELGETEPEIPAPSTGDENIAVTLIMLAAGISGLLLLFCGLSYKDELKKK